MGAPSLFQHPSKTFIEALSVAGILIIASTSARAAPEDDVRAVFDQFVKAQNSHDLSAMQGLLLDSPNFL